MNIKTISCNAFQDQRPGTSGLRKKVKHFFQPHYLEAFLQACFNSMGDWRGRTLIAGGDGRYGNDAALQILIQMAAAHKVAKIIIGQDGILSTPAVSHLIRKTKSFGGFVFSASHNPGGPEGDFGVKFNITNGGPAPESVTEAIYAASRKITSYRLSPLPPIDLSKPGSITAEGMAIEIVDSVEDYAELMEKIFDFDLIRSRKDFRFIFDGMHAVTGPYAKRIFVDRLRLPLSSLINVEPKRDFGGHHPDPNPAHAEELMRIMLGDDAPDLGAASDGDGDRNMIVGPKLPIGPSDSLAILAANATLIPGYKDGLAGIARSMPTSRAADKVAQHLNIPCFETPTGWKFFGNLMDAGKVTLCGEESYGTGSDHVREKDGLWAILFWMNIMAHRKASIDDIMKDHWAIYGRHYYSRHDYEELPLEIGMEVMEHARLMVKQLNGKSSDDLGKITHSDDFSYTDPIDGSISTKQGVRILFENNDRIVLRLSGTGTSGATLRLYLEHYEPSPDRQWDDPQQALEKVIRAADYFFEIKKRTQRTQPDVIT